MLIVEAIDSTEQALVQRKRAGGQRKHHERRHPKAKISKDGERTDLCLENGAEAAAVELEPPCPCGDLGGEEHGKKHGPCKRRSADEEPGPEVQSDTDLKEWKDERKRTDKRIRQHPVALHQNLEARNLRILAAPATIQTAAAQCAGQSPARR